MIETAHNLGIMNVLCKLHSNLPITFDKVLVQQWQYYPDSGGRGKVRGSPKALGISLWGPQSADEDISRSMEQWTDIQLDYLSSPSRCSATIRPKLYVSVWTFKAHRGWSQLRRLHSKSVKQSTRSQLMKTNLLVLQCDQCHRNNVFSATSSANRRNLANYILPLWQFPYHNTTGVCRHDGAPPKGLSY